MTFHIITIFPEIFNSYFNESIIKRAQESGKIKIKIHNLRDYTKDKHKTVDDTPYGGGAGMVMKVDVLYKALRALRQQTADSRQQKIILLSAKGKTWNQPMAKEYTKYDDIILICGRYEGVDERILNFVDEEISIGDYVLTGGEIPAMAIVDSIARLIPGVVGNEMSPLDESHTESGVLEYPQYTRPEIFIDEKGEKYSVPDILKSGNHAEIKKWREKQKRKRLN
ncbi:tRNA (guanosine(37)-N1)-methyltransferase TrmD [Candidatus Parcubacteria bacterium]|nr:tRNA (guanosine(37)-N1)-methyltransferase TrmD [Candidatus Parcubacteria bacterium]